MQLPGRLSATTLGDVLGTLYRGRACGVLELVECSGSAAGRCHRLHLRAGLVGQVETPLRVLRVGEILRQEGFLRADAARRLVRRLVEEPGKRAGQLLVAEQLATAGQVAAALRHQLILRLEAVFAIREALLRFHVAGSRPREPASEVPLSPHEFLRGRPRARDQERQRVAEPQRVGVRAGVRGESAGLLARRRRALSVLGLPEAADRQVVQRAFRRLAAKLHPDRHPRASQAQLAMLMRDFAELTAAYHELIA